MIDLTVGDNDIFEKEVDHMLRNEIQEKTGLTRKAIEYYEEKGLINPQKLENGYRNYSEEDLLLLSKISDFRKLGMGVKEIEKCINTDYNHLSSVLRRKEHELDIDEKRINVLTLLLKGENEEIVKEKIALIEGEETIYEKLTRIFPDYFGQLIFASYKPFLNESLDSNKERAFKEYINFLDELPKFELSKDERDYIEKIDSNFDMGTIESVIEAKNKAVESAEIWLEENKEAIKQYELYKSSDEYKNSVLKKIQDKLKKFMEENDYYEVAIPLIRKFSKSYDEYYKKLLKANELYLNHKA